jgi:hypothetical protein
MPIPYRGCRLWGPEHRYHEVMSRLVDLHSRTYRVVKPLLTRPPVDKEMRMTSPLAVYRDG